MLYRAKKRRWNIGLILLLVDCVEFNLNGLPSIDPSGYFFTPFSKLLLIYSAIHDSFKSITGRIKEKNCLRKLKHNLLAHTKQQEDRKSEYGGLWVLFIATNTLFTVEQLDKLLKRSTNSLSDIRIQMVYY